MQAGGGTNRKLLAAIAVIALALLLGACADSSHTESERSNSETKSRERVQPPGNGGNTKRVDPRRGGLEIGLGEWALTPEASAIRPGRVNFVIRNRGTINHGFEIELEGDSSGHGSGDLFKAESEVVEPGEFTRLSFDLPAGVYKIECLIEGHDDKGMEGLLEVRRGAPLKKATTSRAPGRVAIADFAFSPATARVPRGTEVTWSNDDPTGHTVTAAEGEFGSGTLDSGDAFSFGFEEPGLYEYRCAIHPEMEGTVRVK